MVVSLLELIGTRNVFLELSMKYLDIIKQSIRKTLINKILTRLLWLEFKSDNILTSKAIKFIVEKILPDYK